MINSIGNSGGRTSAFMSFLFRTEKVDPKMILTKKCEYVFCDTGGEDPETYNFLRACNSAFDLNVICLGAVVHESMGKGNTFEKLDIENLTFNLDKMKAVIKKYGGFTNNRPHCTDKLKTIIVEKYRRLTHGKGNHQTWIGIRYDEPKRLVGNDNDIKKSAYKQLVAQGFDDDDVSELFCDISKDISQLDCKYAHLKPETKQLLSTRIAKQSNLGLRYLAQISKIDKQGVIDWWAGQSFDLKIDEHLGNCMFCVKKSELKVALASRDRPTEWAEWCKMVNSDDVRLMPADKFGKGKIYRRWLSPEANIAQFSSSSTEELRERVYKTKKFDTGSCSESCEAFGELD